MSYPDQDDAAVLWSVAIGVLAPVGIVTVVILVLVAAGAVFS